MGPGRQVFNIHVSTNVRPSCKGALRGFVFLEVIETTRQIPSDSPLPKGENRLFHRRGNRTSPAKNISSPNEAIVVQNIGENRCTLLHKVLDSGRSILPQGLLSAEVGDAELLELFCCRFPCCMIPSHEAAVCLLQTFRINSDPLGGAGGQGGIAGSAR